jgi:DNA-directed RNA polymerase specialized sigma subunit
MSKKYLTGEQLRKELIVAREAGHITEQLGKYFMLLVDRIGQKGNWRNYSYLDDMKSAALLNLCSGAWSKFDINSPSSPFSYYTTCIERSFIQYLTKQHKQRDILDEIKMANGLDPSFNRQLQD